MWFIDLKQNSATTPYMTSSMQPLQLNYTHTITNTEKIITFYHRCCYSLVPSTRKQAIKKDVIDKTLASTKGHLRHSCQGVLFETHHNVSTPYNECAVKIKPLGRVHTDQTGKFLYVSTRGYKYIRILYAYDFNAILSTSLRPKSGSDQLAGTKSIYERLNLKG